MLAKDFSIMPQVRKNRFLAAVYSFLVWGLGEMYAGVTNLKIGLGVVLMILWVIYLATYFILGFHPLIFALIYILVGCILAIDSYRDADSFNVKIEIEEAKRHAPNRCPNCGVEIKGNPRFCPNCGYKLVI